MKMYTKFQLHPPYGLWEEDFFFFFFFFFFFENLPFMLPWQPIKFSDLDKIHMKRRGLFKKYFCKKILNICIETAKLVNFNFSHYKSMAIISCHSNQSSYPIETKKKNNNNKKKKKKKKKKNNYLFPWPINAICEIWWGSASWLQRRCSLKMLTDDGRTTDVCLYYKLTYEP